MENYDDQIKPLILRLKFDIKLREFVSFIFLHHKDLGCLLNWIKILEKQQKYKAEKKFLEFFKTIVKIKNDSTILNLVFTNISITVNDMNVSDDLIIDMLKFIDLKNYS
jgi:hypothetical protein